MKVLFVCTGNICRSPMAEVIFQNICEKHGRKDIVVKSAGTHAINGTPMSEHSRLALIQCGEKLPRSKFKSTHLTDEMLKKFDLVVDVRYVPDPWMRGMERYVEACKQLQTDLQTLYNEKCKI